MFCFFSCCKSQQQKQQQWKQAEEKSQILSRNCWLAGIQASGRTGKQMNKRSRKNTNTFQTRCISFLKFRYTRVESETLIWFRHEYMILNKVFKRAREESRAFRCYEIMIFVVPVSSRSSLLVVFLWFILQL